MDPIVYPEDCLPPTSWELYSTVMNLRRDTVQVPRHHRYRLAT
jgi:hypothetical protein